ncbi:hypothetical protein ACFRI7_02100 [Streptomyces sp. NPDC056716]|uniref:hypothetical protein n=1 Tax=unclassified Streptomyces TaxID=2593676 RepID=UPI0036793EB5
MPKNAAPLVVATTLAAVTDRKRKMPTGISGSAAHRPSISRKAPTSETGQEEPAASEEVGHPAAEQQEPTRARSSLT